MKKLVLLIAFCGIFIMDTKAQTTLKMEPVTTPIYTLWGTDPSTIDRPSTPSALTTSLLSNLTQGGLPNNYAMSVAPYWLQPRYDLSFEKDYGKVWNNIRETFSASVATNHTTDSNALSQGGLGFKFQLLQGKANTKLMDSLSAYQTKVLQESMKAAPDQAKITSYQTAAKNFAQQLAERRLGSIVQISGAISADFAQNQFTNGKFNAFGIWPTYTFRTPYLDFTAIGRVIGYNMNDKIETATDIGGQLGLTYERLNISAEYVYRLQSNLSTTDETTNRYSVMIEYKLTDNAYLQYAFGKNFVSPFTPQTNLITLFGFNLGIGTSQQLSGVGS